MRSLALLVVLATTARASPSPTRCGPESTRRLTRVTRQVPAPKGDPIAALDLELLAYFRLAIPKGLDFDSNDPAMRRRSVAWLTSWAQRKNESGEALTAKYLAAAALVSPDRALEAYARMGQMVEDFAESLLVEPIPAQLLAAPDADARVSEFCEELITAAEPLEERAVASYVQCLQQATNTMVANEWSVWCELRLEQLAPEKYPARDELLGPARAAPVITSEPPAK